MDENNGKRKSNTKLERKQNLMKILAVNFKLKILRLTQNQ